MVPLGCSALAGSQRGPLIIHQQVCNQLCFWMISGAAGGRAVCATNGGYLANRQLDHDTGGPLCAPMISLILCVWGQVCGAVATLAQSGIPGLIYQVRSIHHLRAVAAMCQAIR